MNEKQIYQAQREYLKLQYSKIIESVLIELSGNTRESFMEEADVHRAAAMSNFLEDAVIELRNLASEFDALDEKEEEGNDE